MRSSILAKGLFTLACSAIASGLSLSACERAPGTNNGPREGEGGRSPAFEGAAGPAVELLATARCDLEERCGHVGPQRDHASRDACVTRFRAEHRKELNAWKCRGGINQKELAECVTEIRNNDCGAPIDTLERIVACRSSDLCDRVAP